MKGFLFLKHSSEFFPIFKLLHNKMKMKKAKLKKVDNISPLFIGAHARMGQRQKCCLADKEFLKLVPSVELIIILESVNGGGSRSS